MTTLVLIKFCAVYLQLNIILAVFKLTWNANALYLKKTVYRRKSDSFLTMIIYF